MNLRVPRVAAGERRVTGRTVLFSLIAFFGAVMVVNVVMVQAAISTFGGVDTPSSYQAGLKFEDDVAAAAAQRALHWTVDGDFESAGETRTLNVDIVDATGEPVSRAEVVARLVHPVDARRDVEIVMEESGRGAYSGTTAAPSGSWRLDLVVTRDGEEMFRSRNRLILQ